MRRIGTQLCQKPASFSNKLYVRTDLCKLAELSAKYFLCPTDLWPCPGCITAEESPQRISCQEGPVRINGEGSASCCHKCIDFRKHFIQEVIQKIIRHSSHGSWLATTAYGHPEVVAFLCVESTWWDAAIAVVREGPFQTEELLAHDLTNDSEYQLLVVTE